MDVTWERWALEADAEFVDGRGADGRRALRRALEQPAPGSIRGDSSVGSADHVREGTPSAAKAAFNGGVAVDAQPDPRAIGGVFLAVTQKYISF